MGYVRLEVDPEDLEVVSTGRAGVIDMFSVGTSTAELATEVVGMIELEFG